MEFILNPRSGNGDADAIEIRDDRQSGQQCEYAMAVFQGNCAMAVSEVIPTRRREYLGASHPASPWPKGRAAPSPSLKSTGDGANLIQGRAFARS
jgi:hypothetical protein